MRIECKFITLGNGRTKCVTHDEVNLYQFGKTIICMTGEDEMITKYGWDNYFKFMRKYWEVKEMINNFRQYMIEKISQTKKDRIATKLDTLGNKKKGLDDYQKAYYDARLGLLQELYDDCKKYEWKLRD